MAYVQGRGYRSDPRGQEWFQHPVYTLFYGGDCEDLAGLFMALGKAVGLETDVVWINQPGKPLNHVSAKVRVGDEWLWAEASVKGALLGEHPYAAIARLGAWNVLRYNERR